MESATSALPLHRLVLFFCGVLGVLAIKSQTHLSVLETVAHFQLSAFSSLERGVFMSATLGDLAVGFLAVLVGWLGVRASLLLVFSLAGRSTDLWARSRAVVHERPLPRSADRRKAAIEVLDASLKEPQGRLRTLTAMSEVLCGAGVGLVFASRWGNVLDLVFGILFLVVTLGLVVGSVRLFVADVFGPAMVKAYLQGRTPPTPWDSV